MIPLLAYPALNRPDLLARSIASIDHPVEHLLVIDNSGTGGIADGIEPPDLVRHYFVAEQPANLGFGGSINYAIKAYIDQPWWVIANIDTLLGPGDLERLAAEMEKPGPRMVGIVDWRVFGENFAFLEAVGWWDENYHPAYVEDVDIEYRARLAGVPQYVIDGTTSHVGSVCYADGGNPNRRHNERTYPANRAYHVAKWGGDIRGGETYSTPFNRGGSIRDWTLDPKRLRDHQWR